jgi:hypothetical protein
MSRRVGLLVVLALAAVCSSASLAQPPPQYRFTGYAEGAGSGPGHLFFVGDGLNLAFRDDAASGTRYRVCWRRGVAGRHCRLERTRRIGLTSKIFIRPRRRSASTSAVGMSADEQSRSGASASASVTSSELANRQLSQG